jgi:hypothetical protein
MVSDRSKIWGRADLIKNEAESSEMRVRNNLSTIDKQYDQVPNRLRDSALPNLRARTAHRGNHKKRLIQK